MRPLLVIDRFGSGGAQTQLAILAHYLRSAGHYPGIATYHPNDLAISRSYLDGIPLYAMKRRMPLGANIPWDLAHNAREHDADVILSFLGVPSLYSALARRLLGGGVGLVVGERSAFVGGVPSIRQRVERMLLADAHAIVANSHAHAATLKKRYTRYAERIQFVPNAVDGERFKYSPTNRSDRLRVVSVGRIVRSKNVHRLISAAIEVSASVELSVTWYGKIHDKEYYEECVAMLREAPVGWTWGGEIENPEQAYAEADLFVLPSLLEGMSNSVVEAFASGVPCAISNVADAGWLTNDGTRALLFDPLSEGQVAQTILRFARMSTPEVEEMRRQSIRFVRETLSVSAVGSQYESILAKAAMRSQ